MNRSELVKALELTKPALLKTDLVPVFTCYAIGKTVAAFNDDIGIVAPVKVTDKRFAVSGKVLLDLLKASHVEDVTFDLKEEKVVVNAARSTYNLPYFKKDDILFEEPPEDGWETTIQFSDSILYGIETCRITAATDETMKAIHGVTFDFTKGLILYSCDGDAISRFTPAIKAKSNGKVYRVENSFCDAAAMVCRETDCRKGTMKFNSDWVLVELENDYRIYGRLKKNTNPFDYAGELKAALSKEDGFIKRPQGLEQALERAKIIGDPETATTKVEIKDGKLKMVTESSLGVVDDLLGYRGHKDVKTTIYASLVLRCMGTCAEMLVQPHCTAFKNEALLVVVSNSGD